MEVDARREYLSRIAWMYYYGSMSQQQIAERLGLSRVKVTRLLKEVHETGIVEIVIKNDAVNLYSIEEELRRTTGLQYAVVVPNLPDVSDAISRGIAHFINDIVSPVGRLAVGLARTIATLPNYLDASRCGIREVVSLSGTATPALAMVPNNPGMEIATKIGVDFYPVWSPVIVAPGMDPTAVKADKFISSVISMAEKADLAIVGIGNVQDSQLRQMGYISEEELARIQDSGVVGEVIGNYFRMDGTHIATSIDDRLVSVDFPMHCPVIGAAGGSEKARPIVGAILAGYLQGLVTDENTAREVIALVSQE